MDIDNVSFPSRLLDILVAVSESHCVSFDLELSGVPVRESGKASGKASLQERYLEIKQAAEQYQILQIGLTCVKEDPVTGAYECVPYNINLSPIIQGLDIDRTFSFHSGAVQFLVGVGFDFEGPFKRGVPYLSRQEAILAEKKALARQDRAAFADIVVKPDDLEILELMRNVRIAVDKWKAGRPESTDLYITPAELGRNNASDELSRLERRLIHQQIRSEYPDLVTIPRRGIIQIVPFDQEREDSNKKRRIRETRELINRQIGFRWIIEAISGNDFRAIDIRSFAKHPDTGADVYVDLDRLRAEMARASHALSKKPRPVFGHNLFLDLIYLYHTFVGELPDTVEEFGAAAHDLFPVIVDTKYMATHNCGDIHPASSLQQIAEQLDHQATPIITTHKRHSKYEANAAFHEAGYDSLLTAQIGIRLSAKLEAAGDYGQQDGEDVPSPAEDSQGGGVRLNGATDSFVSNGSPSFNKQPGMIASAIEGVRDMVLNPIASATSGFNNTTSNGGKGTTFTSASSLRSSKSKARNGLDQKSDAQRGFAGTGRFASNNVFDRLNDTSASPSTEIEDEVMQFDQMPPGDGTFPAPNDAPERGPDTTHAVGWGARPKWEPMKLMPRFDSTFWQVYGNKLRVFGTIEGLAEMRQAVDTH